MAAYHYSPAQIKFMQDLPFPPMDGLVKNYTVDVPTLLEDTGFSDRPPLLVRPGTALLLGCGQNFSWARYGGQIFRY